MNLLSIIVVRKARQSGKALGKTGLLNVVCNDIGCFGAHHAP